MRFNRFRNERGHVFQGRYKAFNVEPGQALGSVCHYIHLNPIRAKMMDAQGLAEWPWCSLQWIMQPKKRKAWFDLSVALRQSAELTDTTSGRRAYVDYLSWLSADEDEQKKQCFERLSRGWAVGSDEFKRGLLGMLDEPPEAGGQEVAEARELLWEMRLSELKARLSAADMHETAKSADWKVALAAEMKRHTTATNRWLSNALDMGNEFTLSSLAAECHSGKRAARLLKHLTSKCKV